MANVKFDTTELSSLGLSVVALNGRALASWDGQRVVVLGRDASADTGGRHADSKTTLAGMLAGTTSPPTKASLEANFQALKDLLDPELGYKKLFVTGLNASTTQYRWVRFTGMDYNEQKAGPGASIFKVPFNPIAIEFENLEPYWRVPHATVSGSGASLALSNAGKKDTRPKITVTIATTVVTSGQITLFTMGDGLQVLWDTTRVPLNATDKILIDSENLTATKQSLGAGAFNDATRAYDYTPVSNTNKGWPLVPKGGGSIASKHANVGNISVDYDELYK